MVDVSTKYLYNGFPYLGKEETKTDASLPTHVVLKLVDALTGNGHNITVDNFFTSLSLVKKLSEKNIYTRHNPIKS